MCLAGSMRRAAALLLSCLCCALFVPASVKADDDAAKSHEAWSSTLEAEFERLRTTLPTLDYEAAHALLQEAKARVGPRPATLLYPQDKIEHMVVLFVENRASDHIWGCMLGDRPGFDGIPSNSSAATDNVTGCGTATLVCKGRYASTKFNASQLPVKAAIAENYGVHNRMFTSVPGPSWPNHNFAQSATSCGTSSNVMYNTCGGQYPQFPQMTIYDSLALAGVPFGLYVNMTCGPSDPKNTSAESCSQVRALHFPSPTHFLIKI
eukprot:COSAG03_NODE_1531_length_3926_cov_86.591325_2_plen_265_part_00